MSDRKRNILLFTRSMIPGGTEKEVQLLTENIDRESFKIYIAALNGKGAIADELKKNGYLVLDLKFSSFKNLINIFRIFHLLNEFIKINNIHIIHSYGYEPTIFGYFLKKLTGTLLISSQRNIYMLKDKYHSKILSLILPNAECILTNSIITKKTLLELNVKKFKNIHTIYNLVQNQSKNFNFRKQFFKKFNLKNNPIVIGTVSNLRPIKNPELFLKIAIKICKSLHNTYFFSIGAGNILTELRKKVIDEGLQNRIYYLGHNDTANLYYKCMDIFILTSKTESSSMAILEAMNHGLPIIATDVGGNHELVKNGLNGYLCPLKAETKFLSNLEKLILNTNKRDEMGEQSKIIFEKKFNKNDTIKQLEKVYRKINL